MPQLIASVGDLVHWGENEQLRVVDIAYRNIAGPSTESRGALGYKVEAAHGGVEPCLPDWIPASEVKLVDVDVLNSAMPVEEFWAQINVPDRLIGMGMKMVGWLDGLEMRSDNSKLYEIVTILLAIQYDKEGFYGSSWKGKGEYRGIMANLDRKYDRLDKITDDEINGKRKPLPTAPYEELEGRDISELGESKVDAIADLANYCLLYLSYIKDTYPGAFDVWVSKNVPKYLRDKIPFIAR